MAGKRKQYKRRIRCGTKWSVASRQEVTDEDTTEPDTTDDSADDESDSGDDESSMGYTASELAEKIREKEKEIRELDITKRKAALELEEAKKVSGDGILKSQCQWNRRHSM